MLSILITILAFVFTISLLVFIHEGGHFLVAKWARVWVHEFAIGFGPAIWKRKRGETQYALRILPLGGFVRLAGEDKQSEEDQHVPQGRLFTAKSPFTRIAIILAGPLMNILAAVLLMIAYVSLFGVPYVEIAEVASDSPAYGLLQSGDKIVKLGGEEIYFPEQIQAIVQRAKERPLEAVIDRAEKRFSTQLTPYLDRSRGQYLIGIYFRLPLSQIGNLPENSTLAAQGLKEGDVILAVSGQPVSTWPELMRELTRLHSQPGPIPVRLWREEALLPLTLDPAQIDLTELQSVQFLDAPVIPTYGVIQRVEPSSFWAEQGIREGDRLISANGQEISSQTNLIKAILRAYGGDGQVHLVIERAGQRRALVFDVNALNLKAPLEGLQFQSAQRRPQGIWASISIGIKRIGDTLSALYFAIKQVIAGRISPGEAFRGPVGIANIVGWSLNQGFQYFFQLVALLSLMLGIFNLIPFPALDGSRIVFALYELVRGKPIPPEKEGWVHYIGFILLMGLVVLITWQDIQRLFQGKL